MIFNMALPSIYQSDKSLHWRVRKETDAREKDSPQLKRANNMLLTSKSQSNEWPCYYSSRALGQSPWMRNNGSDAR